MKKIIIIKSIPCSCKNCEVQCKKNEIREICTNSASCARTNEVSECVVEALLLYVYIYVVYELVCVFYYVVANSFFPFYYIIIQYTAQSNGRSNPVAQITLQRQNIHKTEEDMIK